MAVTCAMHVRTAIGEILIADT